MSCVEGLLKYSLLYYLSALSTTVQIKTKTESDDERMRRKMVVHRRKQSHSQAKPSNTLSSSNTVLKPIFEATIQIWIPQLDAFEISALYLNTIKIVGGHDKMWFPRRPIMVKGQGKKDFRHIRWPMIG